ncbi:Rap guanine nucleotide exchange factor 1 [Schistosoma japonicum]|nr:Rap guanine nucleotide exchange factor 1 [Schistosoma japonicum]
MSSSNVSNAITTSPSDTTSSTTATTVIPNENNNSILSGDANCESITDYDDYLPKCHSEVKSDTEDAYEIIEANGKKYRRHFQRRVVIERHKVREVILAPSLPDGTGPDLNRVVINRPDQSNPKSVNIHDRKHDDELIPSVETLSLDTSGGTSSSDISASHYPAFKPQFGKWNFSCDIADKHNDCLDHIDLEELKLVTLNTEPPKPPLPSEKPLVSYMFRFGSSNCDNPDDERRLSNRLIDFFRDQWLKEESSEGPHERKKTISYIQSYSQPTTNGDFIHKSTCIQHTCTVRMVGGLQGLKAQANRNAGMKLPDILSDEISDKVSCDSLASSSNEIKSEEVDVSEQLDFSSLGRRELQIITTGEETDDEELHENHIPTQEREIYVNIPVVETTNTLPILSLLKANEYLVWGDRNAVNDISVHAGCIDALIVYMTSYGRMLPSYYLFFETFLFMYRSFMTSDELVNRLITRYQYFSHPPRYLSHLINLTQEIRSKVCSSTVSILVTVVTRLKRDLNDDLLRILQNFEETLSQDGYSSLCRILHITLCRQSQFCSNPSIEPVNNIHKSNSFISNGGGRASSLGDISPEQSLLDKSYETNQYTEYNGQVGFITLPKTKSKRSQVLENTDRYSLVESSENDHANAPIINSLSSKRLMLNTSKSGNPGLLSFSAKSLAEQLTYLECLNYYKVDVSELLDISKLERGKAPGVAACAHHFTIVSNWATYQILCLTSASDRDKVANRLLDVMEHLYKLQNFSSYLSLLCAFLLVPDALFSRKTRSVSYIIDTFHLICLFS